MTSAIRRQKRAADVAVRICNPERPFAVCVVLECGQPTTAGSRSGLNRAYCRRHVEHYRRHGSYAKAGYTAAELNAYRAEALQWLQANAEAPDVLRAVAGIRALYTSAGRPQEAFRYAGKSPQERARATWARLREYEVDPAVPIAAWIAVSLRHMADPQPERRIEYRWMQAAKLVHRVAGGSHRRWERERRDGGVEVIAMHKYPVSRGRVLRHIGESLAGAAKPIEAHLREIQAACLPIVANAPARLPRVRKRSRD